jgi:hypothetical protein
LGSWTWIRIDTDADIAADLLAAPQAFVGIAVIALGASAALTATASTCTGTNAGTSWTSHVAVSDTALRTVMAWPL